MKGFRFKLQPILKIKEIEEDRLMEEVIVLRQAHAQVIEELDQLSNQKENQLLQLQSIEGEGKLNLDLAMLSRNYIDHLQYCIELTKLEEMRRQQALEEGFDRLVEKTKERKILEKLKEKHKTLFVEEQLRKMQNELDDLAQGRFNHQKSKHVEAQA